MGPVLYVMAIMGCGDAGAACQELRVMPATYQSVDQCNRASEAALARTDADYPVIQAQCRQAGPGRVAEVTRSPQG